MISTVSRIVYRGRIDDRFAAVVVEVSDLVDGEKLRLCEASQASSEGGVGVLRGELVEHVRGHGESGGEAVEDGVVDGRDDEGAAHMAVRDGVVGVESHVGGLADCDLDTFFAGEGGVGKREQMSPFFGKHLGNGALAVLGTGAFGGTGLAPLVGLAIEVVEVVNRRARKKLSRANLIWRSTRPFSFGDAVADEGVAEHREEGLGVLDGGEGGEGDDAGGVGLSGLVAHRGGNTRRTQRQMHQVGDDTVSEQGGRLA